MKTIHVLNPAAGQGGALMYSGLENVYITRGAGDGREFARKTASEADEEINFEVYGGDGTVNEVAQGIMQSGSDKAYISLVATGTGNDLIRSIERDGRGCICADVLTVNDRIALNTVNTGFDLDVVIKAARYKQKPLISGSLAYILGVITTLLGKFGSHMRIDYVDKNGESGFVEGDCLLAVAGKGCYYGGGFMASPAARPDDGLIDLMVVKKVSRLRFISLVGRYKKGEHIDIENEKPISAFEDIMLFKKCRQVVIGGIKRICFDGEIEETDCARIGIKPGAVKILGHGAAVTV